MFGQIGIEKLLLLLCVALLLFGAKRLPEVGASVGRGIREFKRNMVEGGEVLTDGLSQAERDGMPRAVPDDPHSGVGGDRMPKRLSS